MNQRRKIIVTGASSGIGRATAQRFAADGCDVCVNARRQERLHVTGHHLPLRRAGRPEEIAGVAAFLAGPDATYITGQILTVDGGMTITF